MDFPHLNDTKFPNVGNVDVYAYQNDFDYPRWKPNTKAYLVNVRWNGDYADCVKFESDEARDDWFDSLVANTIEDNPDCAVMLDKLGTNFIQNFIKVPLPYDRAAQFNYLVVDVPVMTSDEFDYQSDRHCAKTLRLALPVPRVLEELLVLGPVIDRALGAVRLPGAGLLGLLDFLGHVALLPRRSALRPAPFGPGNGWI